MIFIDAAKLSMNGSGKPVEVYVPLWFANGTTTNGFSATSAGTIMLTDGVASGVTTGSPTGSNVKLFTLSPAFDASTRFAFETNMRAVASSGGIAMYFALWDFTTNSVVADSQVTTMSTSFITVRSGNLTLNPSHIYGVTGWTLNTNFYLLISDASLIIFP